MLWVSPVAVPTEMGGCGLERCEARGHLWRVAFPVVPTGVGCLPGRLLALVTAELVSVQTAVSLSRLIDAMRIFYGPEPSSSAPGLLKKFADDGVFR